MPFSIGRFSKMTDIRMTPIKMAFGIMLASKVFLSGRFQFLPIDKAVNTCQLATG
jgi:hypothetical protein